MVWSKSRVVRVGEWINYTPIFRDNHHKNKAIFMGALVGALILTFFNETKEKHHLNRRYDSESGTKI